MGGGSEADSNGAPLEYEHIERNESGSPVNKTHLSFRLIAVFDGGENHLQMVLDKLLVSGLSHHHTKTLVQETLASDIQKTAHFM